MGVKERIESYEGIVLSLVNQFGGTSDERGTPSSFGSFRVEAGSVVMYPLMTAMDTLMPRFASFHHCETWISGVVRDWSS